jgi:hypothetical protein
MGCNTDGQLGLGAGELGPTKLNETNTKLTLNQLGTHIHTIIVNSLGLGAGELGPTNSKLICVCVCVCV